MLHYFFIVNFFFTAPNFRVEVQWPSTRGYPITGQESTKPPGALRKGGRISRSQGGTLISAGEIQTHV